MKQFFHENPTYFNLFIGKIKDSRKIDKISIDKINFFIFSTQLRSIKPQDTQYNKVHNV